MKHLFMVFFYFHWFYDEWSEKYYVYKPTGWKSWNSTCKKGEHLKLTTLQLEELSKIFNEKFERVQTVLAKYSVKSEVSKEMTKIEDEFTPKVESILTFNQRLALHNERKSQ